MRRSSSNIKGTGSRVRTGEESVVVCGLALFVFLGEEEGSGGHVRGGGR
jgi:hypothetical protein